MLVFDDGIETTFLLIIIPDWSIMHPCRRRWFEVTINETTHSRAYYLTPHYYYLYGSVTSLSLSLINNGVSYVIHLSSSSSHPFLSALQRKNNKHNCFSSLIEQVIRQRFYFHRNIETDNQISKSELNHGYSFFQILHKK